MCASDENHREPRRYPCAVQQRPRRVDTSGMRRSRDRFVPAQGRTRSLPRPSQIELATAIGLLAVSPVEEDFFRAGDALSESTDFSDLDDDYRPDTLWRSIVGWLRGQRTASLD